MDKVGRAADLILTAVLHLDAEDLDHILDGLAGSPKVAAAGWRVRERSSRPELYPARNTAIRRRRLAGATYGELAMDFGLSRSTIARIVKRGRQLSVSA